ncbi:unnamed protein product [Caenorhabditis sp. 36 PRJEB53466]|nr:unnamed protein product [Caenorhabditis sp. 36 PRJEB53466]
MEVSSTSVKIEEARSYHIELNRLYEVTKGKVEAIRIGAGSLDKKQLESDVKEAQRLLRSMQTKIGNLKRLSSEIISSNERKKVEINVSSHEKQLNQLQRRLKEGSEEIGKEIMSEERKSLLLTRDGKMATGNIKIADPEIRANRLQDLVTSMAQTVDSNEQTMSSLVHSSSVLGYTQSEYDSQKGHITTGRKLLSKYEQREFTEKILLVFFFLFYFGMTSTTENKAYTSVDNGIKMVELVHELAELLREAKDDEAKRLLTRVPNLIRFNDDSGRSTVHFAAVGGSLPLLQLAILNNPEDVNKEDELGWTPLMVASSAGRAHIVRYLLTQPLVDVKHANANKQTSLHYACSKNHIEIVKLLIGADPDCINLPDKFGATALHRAASMGHDTVIRALISTGKCSLNKQDSEGNTPLHLAGDEDHGDVAVLLVHRGADIGINNNEKMTPLQMVKNSELRQKLKMLAVEKN